jgi:hypothetical protein
MEIKIINLSFGENGFLLEQETVMADGWTD